MALLNKGGVLGELGRPEEALAAYGEVLARFGDDPDPALRDKCADARAAAASCEASARDSGCP